MLPKETQAKAYLQQHYTADFDAMTGVLDLALHIVTNPMQITKPKGLYEKVIITALGVYVKACKQYRSIQVLCEHGLTEDAQALCRNLCETTIALYFLLRHRVKLKNGNKPVPAVPGKPLSTKFRSDLYLAHGILQKEKMLNDMGQTKGMKGTYNKIMKSPFPNTVATVKALLAPTGRRESATATTIPGPSFAILCIVSEFLSSTASCSEWHHSLCIRPMWLVTSRSKTTERQCCLFSRTIN
jgi:hypothetical protein